MAQPSDMGQSDAAYVLVPQPPNSMQDDLPEVFRLPLCNGQDLYEVSVDELQHLFTSGALTSEDYVQFCLDHVQKVNRSVVPSFVELNHQADQSLS